MRVLVVGGTGTIGSAAAQALSTAGHEVVGASRTSEHTVDASDPASIETMFAGIGSVDAVVSAIGGGRFVPAPEATPEQIDEGLSGKLAGQANLVLHALPNLSDGGSITLISGILNHTPIRGGAIAAMINGGLDAFVHVASHELPRGIRLNAVSPTVVEESLDKYGAAFPGFEPTPVSRVGAAVVRSVSGIENGEIFKVW